MLYFNLRPNYTRIKNYFPWNATPEQLQEANPDGYKVEVDFWDTDERFVKIFNTYSDILKRYDLEEWGDDILLLLLLKYKTVEENIYDLELDYANRKRAKELAQLLLLAKQTPTKKYNKLSVASLTDTAKVSDPEIISWISELLVSAIEKEQYPVSLFGLAAVDMYMEDGVDSKELNIERLKVAATFRITNVSKVIKENQADLCLFLYKYLCDEADMKPDGDQWFSDKLLNFYFDILEMFGYTNRISIESEPKDWTRTFLMNRLKQINPSLTGK
jgi:hypothetical protein